MLVGMAPSDNADPRWNSLYKVGGVAAWIAVLIFRRWLGEEFLLLRAIGIIRFGPREIPSSVIDCLRYLMTLAAALGFAGITRMRCYPEERWHG